MDKKISYLSRNFDDIKNELIGFSKKYYPELSNDFNDASVGAWIVDMVSAVGDDLSYHTDRMYQETNVNSANSRSSIMNNARMNGIKVPGPKSSMCEVEISCIVDADGNEPNINQLPTLRRGGTVGNSSYSFELIEDVDFNEQFNSNGYSNRKIVPNRDTNGIINGYTVTKNTIAIGGQSKIYKKVILETDLKPFMEIVLPEQNIMNVESIIFKETSNLDIDPQISEFFIDKEEYNASGQLITTYRYFEVDSLSEQYIFGKEYDDLQEITEDNGVRQYYKGKWKGITQKFITEYTDNNYMKIIFGCGTEYDYNNIDDLSSMHNIMAKTINNQMLGILPKAGWTMYVLYRVGGGSETNLAQGAINKVLNADVVFKEGSKVSGDVKSKVIQSLLVYNPTTSVAGKDAPSTEELKYIVKYSIPTQKRCVTLKDYKSKIMQIDPKFGCPFRCNPIEENNKILIPMLGLKYDGTLDSTLPQLLIDNVIEWLTHYKNLTDFVEFRSGRIYNLGFEVDVFVDKNYSTSDVIASIIDKVYSYMDVSKHDMGEDIFIGDLEKNINGLDGVLGLIDLRVFSLYDGKYGDECQLPTYSPINECCKAIPNTFGSSNGGKEKQIDINAIDGVLSGCYDGMYEIKHKETDIHVRVKLR